MKGALLVCGTHSDAGKSALTAGICRWLHRQGVAVAPFKAQNMSLNSVVTPGGAEIGRAQAMQAAACGLEPEAAMNPVLLKPSGARRSQVIVMGRPRADVDANSYQAMKPSLRTLVADALASLRARYDVVVCEGAGSPAEINLRESDLVNLGLARAAGLPVIVVADIDRGGVFASMFGTLALLSPEDQAHVAGFVINKFRGDPAILAPGIEAIEARTGRPVLGVIPWISGAAVDAEDSLALERASGGEAQPPLEGGDTLEVAVVRLRWMSNFTDADALAAEPGIRVRLTRSAADVERADLVLLPGTKATVEDLQSLRADGLDRALAARAAAGAPLLGICGGYQMLGTEIEDAVESRAGTVRGLGLLPVTTRFAEDKVLRRRRGASPWLGGAPAGGYEIRHGAPSVHGGAPLLCDDAGEPEGCVEGNVAGTSWHGLLEHDAFRRALLAWTAAARQRRFVPGRDGFADVRARRLDALGNLVEEHLDTARLAALIEGGVPGTLPTVTTEVHAPACSSS